MKRTIDVSGLPVGAIHAIQTLVSLLKIKHGRTPTEPKVISEAEFDQLCEEFSIDAPPLPPDFSRADMYK